MSSPTARHVRIANARAPYLRAVLSHLSWRKLALGSLLGTALALIHYFEPGGTPPRYALVSSWIVGVVEGVCVLLAALSADEAVARGWQVRYAYPLALVTAAVCASVAQWYLRSLLGVLNRDPTLGNALGRMAVVGMEVCSIGGLALMGYLQRQSSQRMLAELRAAELARLDIERHLIESQLAAARALIEPAALLQDLAAVRSLLTTDLSRALETLETLIATLQRNAVQTVGALARQPPLLLEAPVRRP